MKRILILIFIMCLAGCACKFNVEKANTYLLSHPDRPDHIKEAVSAGTIVRGMNEEEVAICMGKPDTITTRQSNLSNMKSTIWCYFDGAPTKRVCICFIDGAVGEVNEFTQTGMPVVTVNPVPVINPPRNPNVIVQPRPIIINPTVNRNCPSK